MAIVPTSLVAGLAFGVVVGIGSIFSSREIKTTAKTSLRGNPKGRTSDDNPMLLNFGTTTINGGQTYLPDPDMVFRDGI
jgi:hypothetical protein